MAINYRKAYEISEHGLQIEGGSLILSGSSAPTSLSIPLPCIYIRTNGEVWLSEITGVWEIIAGVTHYVAGENIPAMKAVYIDHTDGLAYVASTSTEQESAIVGIAKKATLVGESVSVHSFGELSDASFNFSGSGLVYLGTDGGITSSYPVFPTDAFHVVLGKVLTNNKIMVSIESPITL